MVNQKSSFMGSTRASSFSVSPCVTFNLGRGLSAGADIWIYRREIQYVCFIIH